MFFNKYGEKSWKEGIKNMFFNKYGEKVGRKGLKTCSLISMEKKLEGRD